MFEVFIAPMPKENANIDSKDPLLASLKKKRKNTKQNVYSPRGNSFRRPTPISS